MRNAQTSRMWNDVSYRMRCLELARKAADDEPSDPFAYNRLVTHFRSGVLEPEDFKEKRETK